MDEQFDPYLKWLGIASQDQPANHYRLLGVPELIDDADVIENAADRQMAHVRTFAGGQHAQVSQRILNEISKAKVCLLDPQEKQAYDGQLQAKAASQAPPAPPTRPVLKTRQVAHPQSTPPPVMPPAVAPIDTPPLDSHPTVRLRKRNSTAQQAAVALGLLVVAAGLAWGFYLATSGDPVVVKIEGETEPSEDVTNPPEKTPPKDPVTTPPVVENLNDPGSTETVGTDDPQNLPAVGATINLLEKIDLKRDVVEGNWKIDDKSLVSPTDLPLTRLMVPAEIPEEYQLDLEVERVTGNNMFFVALLVGGKQVRVYFDYHPLGVSTPASSIAPEGRFPIKQGALLPIGKSRHIRCVVTSKRLVVTVDGQVLMDQSDGLDEMSLSPKRGISRKDVVFLSCHLSTFQFHRLQLTPLGKATVAAADSPSAKDKLMDLLRQIDLKRDVVAGDWKMDEGTLIAPAGHSHARMMIPGSVPEEYLLTLEVERISGDNGFIVGLVAEGKQIESWFDYHEIGKTPTSGLINDNRNPRSGSVLKSGLINLVEIHVNSSRIVAKVNDMTVFDRPRTSKLGVNSKWNVPLKDVLFLGSSDSSFRIHKFELTPLGETAVVTTNPPPAKSISTNLLKQIDVARDVVAGTWKTEDGALVSPADTRNARIMIPGVVPEEYQLTLEVERISGDNALVIGVISGRQQIETFFDWRDGGKPPASGFADATHRTNPDGLFLKNKTVNVIQYRITSSSIAATVNGKSIFDRARTPRLGVVPDWRVSRQDVLFLGSLHSSFRIRKFELTKVDNGNFPIVIIEKTPLPEGQELAKAQSTLRDVFQDELAAAKTAKDRIALAKMLLETSADTSNDSAETYVILQAARKLASKAGDPKTALTAIDRLDDQFVIDALEMKSAALTEVAKSVRQQADQVALATLAGGVVLEMVEADQFDQAEPLTKLVQSAAIKSRDVALRKEVAASVKQFKLLQEAYRKVEPAFEKLQETPDDPEANLEVGRYRAFVKHDWPTGLKNLAAGSDSGLKALAEQDLAGADSPSDQAKLGDVWWKLAEAETGEPQKAFKIRAGHWYVLALTDLTGLTKERTNKRLDEIRSLDPTGRIKPRDWIVFNLLPDGTWKAFPPDWMTREFRGGVLTITRKSEARKNALLVYQPFVGNRPFVAVMEIRGNTHQIGLLSAKGEDRAIVGWGPRDDEWHKLTLQRKADKTVHITMDGKPVGIRHWQCDNNLKGKITFWLLGNNTCSIRRFQLKTTSGR